MNQAVFGHIYLYDDAIANARFTDLFARLVAPDLKTQLGAEVASMAIQPTGVMTTADGAKSKNLRPEYRDVGSNFSTLVAGTGFEPATSGL
jgi:hypothetical protein